MSDLFTVQLSRGRVVALSACLSVAAILFFLAGTATGLLVASPPRMATVQDKPRSASKRVASSIPKTPGDQEQQGSAGDGSDGRDDAGSEDTSGAEAPGNRASEGIPGAGYTPVMQSAPAAEPLVPAKAASVAPAANEPSAKTVPAKAEESDTIPLAIRVCSFESKASADRMIASLASHGYQASLAHAAGANGRIWYVVKLGPYSDWDTASTIAAQVAIAENVRPAIAPLR